MLGGTVQKGIVLRGMICSELSWGEQCQEEQFREELSGEELCWEELWRGIVRGGIVLQPFSAKVGEELYVPLFIRSLRPCKMNCRIQDNVTKRLQTGKKQSCEIF